VSPIDDGGDEAITDSLPGEPPKKLLASLGESVGSGANGDQVGTGMGATSSGVGSATASDGGLEDLDSVDCASLLSARGGRSVAGGRGRGEAGGGDAG
jgi:hypothetical protein